MQPKRFQLIAAVFILLIKEDKIFLSKRRNTGWEDGKWSIIGGHLDGGETAARAAIREVREETGVVVDKKDLKFFNVAHIITNSERIHFSFVVRKWKGVPVNNESHKASRTEWFDLNDLPKDLTSISKRTISWYIKDLSYSEDGWKDT